MTFIVANAASFEGQVVANGQCVRFLQVAGNVPHTSRWRPGALVRGGGVMSGTAIATFDDDGTYGNHTDGSSHAAVFIQETKDGIEVWDQWVGQPVHRRLIHFRAGHGKKVNDGDEYYIIESK